MNRVVSAGFHSRVYAVVRRIPAGSVSTYGDVAEALGRRSVARHVGYALAALAAGSDVPWHRVLNGSGRVSNAEPERQRRRLRAEGVTFDRGGRVAEFAARRCPVWVLEAGEIA